MTAHLDDDTLTALALGHRDAGAEGLADHLRVCPACAAALADLAAAVRGTLAAAPSIAPPDWFAGRVLAAGRAERDVPAGVTVIPRRRRLWPAVAASVLAGALLGGAATLGVLAASGVTWPPPPAAGAPTTPLVTGDGETIGTAGVVRLGGGPVLVLSVTEGRPGATYECVLLGADESRTSGGSWTLADPGYGRTPSGAWLVPVDRTGVVGVELVTPEGKVWASAPL